MAKYLDMPGLTYFYNQIKNKFASKTDVGAPAVASTVSAMTDHNKIYVYTGSESGYTTGNWYYYDAGSWKSGGVYNATVYVTDKTLSETDKPADAKATGDELTDLKSDLGEPSVNLYGAKTLTSDTVNGVTFTVEKSTITINGTASASINKKFYFDSALYQLDANDGDTLTMSYEEVSGSFTGNVYLSLNGITETTMRLDLLNSKTFEKTSKMTNINFYVSSEVVFNNFQINLQIEKGNVATPFCRYGGIIVDDKIARDDINDINTTLGIYNSRINNNEKTQLVTDRFTEFVVGTLDGSTGLPKTATYRLRSVEYIPMSAFYKATWDAEYIVIAYCYDSEYGFLGVSPQTSTGYLYASDVYTAFPTTAYIKILFANPTVSTITLNALTDAHFKIFCVLSQINLYDHKMRNDLPVSWDVPYRNILQMQGSGFTFAIQTDTHWNKEVPPFYNALKNLSRRVGLDFIAHLGDIIRGYEYDNVEDSYAEYEKAMRGLVDGAECATFALMGNHDNNSMYATSTGDISDAFLPGELFSLIERPTTTLDGEVVWGSREGMYFYCDFDRVRIIALNTSDLPYTDVSDADISVNLLRISEEQSAWLAGTALRTDKPVLILSHAQLDGNVTISGSNAVRTAINDFVDGGGVVIACIAGHTHKLDATKTNGVNYIVCDNGGDICEIFAVDLQHRMITTQQIGKDFTGSRTFTY